MQGDASWNEYRFRGQLTASGERYDPESMTAASHDLPFDSLVRVTRVDNGKTIVVRINDRTSPDEHIIHLSEAAGRHLGVSPNETQMIRLEPLSGQRLTVIRPPEEVLRTKQKQESRVREDELRAERIILNTDKRDATRREAVKASEPEKKLTLQLGVFSTRRAASDFSGDVTGSWVAPVTVKGREQFRVYYSRFSVEADARVAQRRLKNQGHDSFLRSL